MGVYKLIFASVGCIAICGDPEAFVQFNDFIIELSDPKASNRSSQLLEIGKAQNITIHYMAAKRPTLESYVR